MYSTITAFADRVEPCGSSVFPQRFAPVNSRLHKALHDAVDNSAGRARFFFVFGGAERIFPLVVGQETDRRKRKRLLTTESGPSEASRAKQPMAGTAGPAASDKATRNTGRENAQQAIRVIVAASGVPHRGERDPRHAARRTQPDPAGRQRPGKIGRS